MKLLKNVHMVLFMFVLVVVIAISTYVKFPSMFATSEVQTSTPLAVNKDTQKLDSTKRLEELATVKKQQALEGQLKLKEKVNIETQKKLESQAKANNEKKSEELAKVKEQAKQKKSEQVINQQKILSKNKTSSNNATSNKTTKVATLLAKPKPKLLIDKISGKGNAKQAIVVTTNGFGNVSATITTFENVNGSWKQVSSFAGNVGRAGFTYNKVEGDGHSPIGIYALGTAFGRYSNPGTEVNYRQSTTNDFWVDDVNSRLYNTWQKGPAKGRWTSAEKMYIPQYNYGFVINHNTSKRIPGKGSAIFFHVWSGSGRGTAGCTAAAQTNVINTLKWLKPSKSPVIIEGPMSEILKM